MSRVKVGKDKGKTSKQIKGGNCMSAVPFIFYNFARSMGAMDAAT